MSFPVGEQFFIDSVRDGLKALPDDRSASASPPRCRASSARKRRTGASTRCSTRSWSAQGHVNTWEPRARGASTRLEGLDPRHAVAATAATEHFTAIFAEWMLAHARGARRRRAAPADAVALARAPRSPSTAAPPSTSTARSAATSSGARASCASSRFYFLADVLRQTLRNLWHDGALLALAHLAQRRQLAVRPRRPGPRDLPAVARYFARGLPPVASRTRALGRALAARAHAQAYAVVGA